MLVLLVLIAAGTLFNAVKIYLLEKRMPADFAALNAKVDELGTRLTNVIADLEKKIEDGAPAEDFQPIVDKLQAMVDAVNTADPDPTN